MADGAHNDVRQLLQSTGNMAQQNTLSGSGFTVHHGKASFLNQYILDPPAEVGHAWGEVQCACGNLLREGVPFEPIQGQDLRIHGCSSSVGR
ncbi:hypothetical protein FEMY_03760 [Ferrovum myxofaciens]|uniref:Uncharacterized protein n=1 Tax=Ferrovum myxofaciens TaxID=416213 RepID=A0A149W117_9PROT|nr:hypothetical protein FEMY_03760 [Ferrovum myxofaciens]